MTTAVIIGYGSIGARHARVLREEGCRVGIVSQRGPVADLPCHRNLASALDAEGPDYVVIANETAMHRETLDELARSGFDGRVLVEKPLFAEPAPVPDHRFALCAVGYNLRFHAVLLALRDAVADERVVSAHIYCGQYLPDWRPHTDWRASYSTDRARGGGVLRDLSHELDYLTWLFGDWSRVAATPGNTGTLGIDADDCRCLLVQLERCDAATVQLNYLDRPGRREIIVNGGEHTWRADLGACVLERDGVRTAFSVDRDDSYRAMHRAMLCDDRRQLCTFEEGARMMEFIAAIERAATSQCWVQAA